MVSGRVEPQRAPQETDCASFTTEATERCLTVVGVTLVSRASRENAGQTLRVVVGGALAGGGLFNFIEGLVDHQILGIHHVRPDSAHWLLYDLAFLASGVALWFGGVLLARSGITSHK